MSGAGRKDLCETYRKSLEARVQEGRADLVCRDASLVDAVEGLLRRGGQEVHGSLQNDAFQVIGAALQTAPSLQRGLERLVKGFEVLELAAINLFLCPWRQEFKMIKTFSGVYTHYLKPAFPEQTLLELFQKLGYRPRDRHQLEMGRQPPAEALLQLACGFFAARCESALLLAAASQLEEPRLSAGDLLQERQRCRSLEEVVGNLRRKTEALAKRDENDWRTGGRSEPKTELDLYTEDGRLPNGGDQQQAISKEKPSAVSSVKTGLELEARYSQSAKSTTPRSADGSHSREGAYRSSLKFEVQKTSRKEQGHKTREISLEHEAGSSPAASKGERYSDGKGHDSQSFTLCGCSKSYDGVYFLKCPVCKVFHCCGCHVLEECRTKKHEPGLATDAETTVIQQELLKLKLDEKTSPPSDTHHLVCRASSPPSGICPPESWRECDKKSLQMNLHGAADEDQKWEKHFCLKETFHSLCVCESCHTIHDGSCNACLKQHHELHIVNDRIKQEEWLRKLDAKQWENHSCLSSSGHVGFMCETCHLSHDILCRETKTCASKSHKIFYLPDQTQLKEMTEKEQRYHMHQCITANPQMACQTCFELHGFSCAKLETCKRQHTVRQLGKCTASEKCCNPAYIICMNCCAVFCKNCWFRYPINCTCGHPFGITEV
ncbi:spermatogenesis associated 2-like [Lepisosteus oculatus]|uniref:spermatogenesis associated 2-like n=1 Tax=Lepisosteus oculatus TaxID=7918 RepID=UPI0035F52173